MGSESCGGHVAERNSLTDERHNASEMNIATTDSRDFGLNRESRVEAALNQRFMNRRRVVAFRNSIRCRTQRTLRSFAPPDRRGRLSPRGQEDSQRCGSELGVAEDPASWYPYAIRRYRANVPTNALRRP